MNGLFWFTGLIVWMVAALYGAYLLGRIGWCGVVAIDWVRWAIATNTGPTIWRHVPWAFLRRWAYFVVNGTTSTQWTNSVGVWSGFRRWTFYVR